MDKKSIDNLIKNVLKDDDNSNRYDGLDKLLSAFSDDEVRYFIEKCSQKIFHNDELALIMWETHPVTFHDYIIEFIDKNIERIDSVVYSMKEKRDKAEENEKNEYDDIIKGFSLQKSELLKLRNGFVSKIIHFIKKK